MTHRAKLLDAIAEHLGDDLHLIVSAMGEHELHVTDTLGVWGAVLTVRNEPPPEPRRDACSSFLSSLGTGDTRSLRCTLQHGHEGPHRFFAADRPQCATYAPGSIGAAKVDLCCLLEAGHEGPHCFQGEHGEVQARRPVAD